MLLRSVRTASFLVLGLAAGIASGAPADRPLTEAVKSGNRESVRALVKQRSAVNSTEADGTTALHWAVRAADLEIVGLLLGAGANAKAADRYGITPLSLAAENGDAAAIEMLVKAGADVNATLPNGETVLMTAARTGKPDALTALLSHGAKVNAKENQFGETALMWAAAENNAAAIRVLAKAGADLNARSNLMKFPEFRFITSGMVTTSLPRGNWTPLMYAARQGSIDAARALADAGADLNLTDPDGSNALSLAVINAHFDFTAALLEKGADPNVPDSTGMAALYAAVDMHTLGPMLSRPGPKVTDKLDAADLVKVLLQHGANPNMRLKRPILGRHHDSGDAAMGEGTTPLIRALKSMDVPVIRILVDGGANPSITQRDYSTPMMVVAGGGGGRGAAPASEATLLEVIKLLVDHGADVDAFNANGQTALHVAAGRGADSIIRYLAEKGAKLDMKDKQGRTPLDLASGTGGPPAGGRGAGRAGTAELLRQLMAEK